MAGPMVAISKIIAAAVTTCLLAWPAGANTMNEERFIYYTGCAPIAYKVRVWESPSGAMFINRAKLADMIELSLVRRGLHTHNSNSPHQLILGVVSHSDVATFTLRFLKPMKDERSQVSNVAITYLRAFSITPGVLPEVWEMYIETNVQMRLKPFLDAYVRVNRTAC